MLTFPWVQMGTWLYASVKPDESEEKNDEQPGLESQKEDDDIKSFFELLELVHDDPFRI